MSESKTKRNGPAYRSIHDAFVRAERQRDELLRLKAQHPQYSGLYFHPERLGDSTTDVAASDDN